MSNTLINMDELDVSTNSNGGLHQPGKRCSYRTKLSVENAHLELLCKQHPKKPNSRAIAKLAKVEKSFVLKVLQEIKDHGQILDPEVVSQHIRENVKKKPHVLDKHDAALLLSLRAQDPRRPNSDCFKNLEEVNGKIVSSRTTSNFFRNRFQHAGKFCTPSLMPIDKWKPENLAAFVEFYNALERTLDRTHLNFLDEKHIVNKDALQKKVRRDPLSGHIPHTSVSGDFREAHNIFACITADPTKPPMFYHIRKDNGSALSFMEFVTDMMAQQFLKHDDTVTMDNTTIHSGSDAEPLADLLWHFEADGRPLRILTLPLPTRSPELNPIELTFHILAARVRSFRHKEAGPSDKAVVNHAKKAMDDMDCQLIFRTIGHCGCFPHLN